MNAPFPSSGRRLATGVRTLDAEDAAVPLAAGEMARRNACPPSCLISSTGDNDTFPAYDANNLGRGLVAVADIAGSPEELQEIQANQAAGVHKDTMGNLVEALTKGFLAPRESVVATKNSAGNDGVWGRLRWQVVLGPEQYEVVKSALKELVELRNELVHHFLERFNIWDAEGCTAAEAHLDFSFEVIDGHCRTFLGWAQSVDKARESFAARMATSLFEDLLDGVGPDGSMDWQSCGAVSSLRESEARFAISGWTKLNTATAWKREQHPDQTPQRYGCNSWRQVIHESRQFEVSKEVDERTGRKDVWYRSRPG